MVSRAAMICDSYESGFGHGMAGDGLDLSKTPHSDPELGEAYQIGYEAGQAARMQPTPDWLPPRAGPGAAPSIDSVVGRERMAPQDKADAVSKALHVAWNLGQTYWQQADSEYTSKHRKADETRAKFLALVEETRNKVLARNG